MRTHLSQLWLCAAILAAPLAPAQAADNTPDVAARPLQTLARQPLHFEPLSAPHDGDFVSRGRGVRLQLSATGATLMLPPASGADPDAAAPGTLSWQLVGARADARGEGEAALPGRSHYFMGSDPAQWRRNVPNYARVRYPEVYPGIDLVYHGDQRELEYDFMVTPGADPAQIRLRFDGAQGLSVNADGDLLIRTASGELRHRRPTIYQIRDGQRSLVEGRYELINSANGLPEVAFALASYDPQHELIIDPVLKYASYFGGEDSDTLLDMIVDAQGYIYVAGYTYSKDFPLEDALNDDPPQESESNGFISKLTPDGSALVYSSYFGGIDSHDGTYVKALAADAAGNVYLTGYTSEDDFPVVNAFQEDLKGVADAFVSKLSADGATLIYSTLLGGNSGIDQSQAIAVDATGAATVVGYTGSDDFPLVAALDASCGFLDAFVSTLTPSGSALSFSTFIGGSDIEDGLAIALSANGDLNVCGLTDSKNFPVLNAVQPKFGSGAYDAFVLRIKADRSGYVYSTYLGGGGSDRAYAIDVDTGGAVYVAGDTASPDFPTATPLQASLAGDSDAFLTKIEPDGSALAFSTFIGGNGQESISDLEFDATGAIYAVGVTTSDDLRLVDALMKPAGGGDLLIVKVDTTGSALLYQTPLGGVANDSASAVDWGVDGSLVVAGNIYSSELPTTADAVQPIFGGEAGNSPDTYLIRIGEGDSNPDTPHFKDVVDQLPGATIKSNSKVLSGFDGPSYATILGGEYVVNNASSGVWSVTPTLLNPGDQLRLKAVAASTPATSVTVRLNVGAVTDHWVVTTAATIPPDASTPDPFNFAPKLISAIEDWVNSEHVTPTGFSAPAPISVTGGEYRYKTSTDGWSLWSDAPDTLQPGNETKVQVRVESSNESGTTTSATLTIGGVSAVFSVTTGL